MIKRFKYLFWIGILFATFSVSVDLIFSANNHDKGFVYAIYIVNYIFLILYILYFFYILKVNSGFVNELIGIHFEEIFTDINVGIVVYDADYNIIWVNEYLMNNGISNMVGNPITRIHSKISNLSNNTKEEVQIQLNNTSFTVSNQSINNTLIFKNNTKYEVLKQAYVHDSKAIGFIKVDNFRNLNSSLLTSGLFKAKEKISNAIQKFSHEYEATIKSYSDDEYIVFMTGYNLKRAMKSDFIILKDIRKYAKSEKLSISLSAGFSFNHGNALTLENLALKSLELARSRGGDQVVVYEYGKGNLFFGAKLELNSSNSKVEVKNFTNNFARELEKCKNVMVFGHINADFDCIGAMLGIVHISEIYGKDVNFLNISNEEKADVFLHKTFNEDKLDKLLVKKSAANKLITKDTMIVIVDVSALDQISGKVLLKKSLYNQIFIIDHHRISGSSFNEVPARQKYIMPSASSTCEIVTEMLNFDNKVLQVPVATAQYLLTGMVLDTNSFKQRTSARTFEAAAILQKWNASILIANESLKLNERDSLIIQKILSSMSMIKNDVYIAFLEDEETADYAQIAKSSQDILNVENRRASFVIARVSEDQIKISARSNGTYNVQLIMEKLNNGGGHFSSAATIIQNAKVSEVVEKITKIIIEN